MTSQMRSSTDPMCIVASIASSAKIRKYDETAIAIAGHCHGPGISEKSLPGPRDTQSNPAPFPEIWKPGPERGQRPGKMLPAW
jgi:hypothetical protein